MTKNEIIPLIIGIVGSSGFTALVTRLLDRFGLQKRVRALEQSTARLELLQLMQMDADTAQVLRVAENYFTQLDGDWYMGEEFTRWCSAKDITVPGWVK